MIGPGSSPQSALAARQAQHPASGGGADRAGVKQFATSPIASMKDSGVRSSSYRAFGVAALIVLSFSMFSATGIHSQTPGTLGADDTVPPPGWGEGPRPACAIGQRGFDSDAVLIKNITAAADFLRSVGYEVAADQILDWLKKGKYYQEDLKDGVLGETHPITKDVTIDSPIVGWGRTGNAEFDPEANFSAILQLAAVLYHENVHAHQDTSDYFLSGFNKHFLSGQEEDEFVAWTREIRATDNWAVALWKKYEKMVQSTAKETAEDKKAKLSLLGKVSKVVRMKCRHLDEFIEDNNGFGYNTAEWVALKKQICPLDDIIQEIIKTEKEISNQSPVQIPKVNELLKSAGLIEKTASKEKSGGGSRGPIKKSASMPASLEKSIGREFCACQDSFCARSVTVFTATDSGKWCAYDDGGGRPTVMIEADQNGEPVPIPAQIAMIQPPSAASDRARLPTMRTPNARSQSDPTNEPAQPGTSNEPSRPSTAKDTPQSRPSMTDQSPVPTPGMPPTTTELSSPPPPPLPDTVFVKAKESVLQGVPTGSALPDQTVKLLPSNKPALPGTGGSKVALDTGFDRPPAQCTTQADGACRIEVPPQDRAFYRLPTRSGQSNKNYRLDIELPKTSGAVLETTGQRKASDLIANVPGVSLASDFFRIGNRTFARLASFTQAHANFSLRDKFDRSGARYEEDICRTKKPGPPLGFEPASLSALNHEIAEAQLKLDRLTRTGRTVR